MLEEPRSDPLGALRLMDQVCCAHSLKAALRQVSKFRMVARANPQLFLADRVRLETNGCVHFEIR